MVNHRDKSNYRQIIKSTGIFGGVQVIQVVSTMIKAKFIAIFLGATGMGISSLLVSSVSLIQTISSLGLNTSAVREISKAKESDDSSKLSSSVIIFRRWLFFSAIMGLLLVMLFSTWLSKFVFQNNDYTFEFFCLSILVTLNILGNGYVTIMQGNRRLKDLAQSSVLGTLLSVLIVIPIYYFLRINGIVLALIVSSFASFIIIYLFSKKVKIDNVTIGFRRTFIEGSEMAKLGIIMMLTSLMSTLTILLIITFIKRTGTISDVGLYQAGMSITNQSIGLVFAAMGVDYFPRLSAVCTNSVKVRNLANQQSEIMLLIITPILLTLVLTAPLIIRILLSKEFSSISNFIRLISLGMFFQAANYSMGLISFAKGDKKVFLLLGIQGNIQWLIFSVVGYVLNGLLGISILFVVHSILCYFITYYTVYKKYNYVMSSNFVKLFILSLLMMATMCICVILFPKFWGIAISITVLCCSLIFSFVKLNELIGLKEIFLNSINRFRD